LSVELLDKPCKLFLQALNLQILTLVQKQKLHKVVGHLLILQAVGHVQVLNLAEIGPIDLLKAALESHLLL
jgi:hypothetical protein